MIAYMENSKQLSIAITLSPAQVDEVVRAASQSRAPSISTMIADTLSAPLQSEDAARSSPSADGDDESQIGGYMPLGATDPRLSRSLLRGLSLLTCFGPDGTARGIVELAEDAGMSPSTAHRYASTLVEIGLLERLPQSRKYRLRGS
ncbi:MAG TPA: helix-turn-helix domain-containing protein [Solirubrobacteraceae bacterium]|nr:helix-turn-helix domain-containing protein [Solirubrobacteraceae bacterium]